MYVLSPEEMKNLDKQTIEYVGIEGIVLMENAGKKAAEILELNLLEPHEFIAVVCGTGNNGGDGLVISRWLHNHNFDVHCYIIGKKEKLSPSAATNYKILNKLSCPITFIENGQQLKDYVDELSCYSTFIDALFGIGLKGEIKGYRNKLVKIVNQHSQKTIAVDVASGVDCASGQISNIAIKADYTITMAAIKYGHILYPGREYSGEVYIVDIGISPETYDRFLPKAEIIEDLDLFISEREADTTKNDYGRISIIAGSRGLTGAAIMSAKSALEMGSGLIKLIHPSSLSDIFETSLLEVMSKSVVETEDISISPDALSTILSFVSYSDAIAIGPGISRNQETASFVREFLKENNKSTVIDADAINAFKDYNQELQKLSGKPYIFTPHIKEFSRLTGIDIDYVKSNIVKCAHEFAAKYNLVLLLKGSTSIITDGNKITFNTTGNAGLSTGGSGDVLSGIIVSLLGQGFNTYDAARIGSFILGKTADIVAENYGEYSTTPSKIIQNIYKTISS
ncbi:MAG: NAD(P)H-hydrate dehydratase [Candidatus Cloacimonetes bacterium]|nr:NAD(P)H-hydrate dehydratase [Candidatus Cloacimonadota bacterium]MBS3767067.1 NAD(P)H-hydrate dehydratase [Candidatus Cloacimonadota bacterium]